MKEIRLLVDSPDIVVAAVLVSFEGRHDEWRFRAYLTGFPLSRFMASLEKGQEGLRVWFEEPPDNWNPNGWSMRLVEAISNGGGIVGPVGNP